MSEKQEGVVTVKASDTDSFLRLFADDPDTVYPVILTTRTLSRPGGPGYTSWMVSLKTADELESMIGDSSLHGQFPYNFRRSKNQTNIDLESGGGFQMGKATMAKYGLAGKIPKNRYVPVMADSEMMQKIYTLIITHGMLFMG